MTAPATPDQGKRVYAYVVGGPLHGRNVTENASSRVLAVATGPNPGDNTYYQLRRYLGSGWRVSIPMWVHTSLIRDGNVVAPAHLLPSYMRPAAESCLLLPRVKK